MLKALRSLRRLLGGEQSTPAVLASAPVPKSDSFTLSVPIGNRPFFRSDSPFQAGDRVLLSWEKGKEQKQKLTLPLRLNEKIHIDSRQLAAGSLIGKWENTTVTMAHNGSDHALTIRARHPTFEEYVSLAPRKVAPIYASYASTLVSLLDIHVAPPDASNDPQATGRVFEILEAGTGHGSVTLHLARAIAAANPPPPIAEKPDLRLLANSIPDQNKYARQQADALNAWASWRETRRAVIHTVEVDKTTRFHAEKLIRSYRGGLYWPHIDFYADEVGDWITRARKLPSKLRPFLDIVILDMPNPKYNFFLISKSLRTNGQLLVYAPQITQIAECVKFVNDKKLPLDLLNVIELGDGISNGRSWNVRLAQVRAPANQQADLKRKKKEADRIEIKDGESDTSEPAAETEVNDGPVMVCRPRVGERIRGGGFIAMWKRTTNGSS